MPSKKRPARTVIRLGAAHSEVSILGGPEIDFKPRPKGTRASPDERFDHKVLVADICEAHNIHAAQPALGPTKE